MDSQSGPTDTPHPSTHSVGRLPIGEDSDSEVDDGVPSEHPLPQSLGSGDDTVRQPLHNVTPPTLHDIVRPSNSQPSPILESPHAISSPVAPFPSTQGTQVKHEPEPSRSVRTSTLRASAPNQSTHIPQNTHGEIPSTSSRRESTATARPHAPNAVSPSVNHSSPLPETRGSIVNSPRISAAPIRSPPEKREPDPASINGGAPADPQRPPLPASGGGQIDTQYVNMLLALDSIPVCLF